MRDRFDMTVTYAMHNALRRELHHLARAAARSRPDLRSILRTAAGWELFRKAWHVHHAAEDDALWPSLRRALYGHPFSLARLEAIEAEHAALALLLEAIDQALTGPDADDPDAGDPGIDGPDAGLDLLGELTGSLVTGLRGHLRHEEEAVFPLIQDILSTEQWEHFGRVHAQRIGADAARILPWLLDGVAERTVAAVLRQLLPESAHHAYTHRWQPAYAVLDRWGTRDARPETPP
ncbi:hemerythrin domain-containing protein [Streptomyces telluris]|uniref:Hemerythrin domain-containing protein n=1 Tax=Streptomyces telluris TaxID=2720021 RepID=A0A9X2RNX1_9ACTN|nr:hemerythrin domain-containing protein [Streptomyces telluris]MCQ8773412.1 hemerythrin domain-containing protein [Streptomyces telluris]